MYQYLGLDMDGTVTQHRTPLENSNREVLLRILEKMHIVMVGAGTCERILRQLGGLPVDVIGNYGMEGAVYDRGTNGLRYLWHSTLPIPDKADILARAQRLREKYGFLEYTGDSVEFHPTGMLTFALLGTKADIRDKLAFDPDRKKRIPMYADVVKAFSDYTVFIGGSSSFDIVPRPYDKRFALARYCEYTGADIRGFIFAGDDYLPGGNDEQVFKSDIPFIQVHDYRDFGPTVLPRLGIG